MPVTLNWRETSLAKPEVRAAALIAGLSVIRDDSIERAPIREGDLRGSCAIDTDGNQGTVYYDTVYAARQHEELGWNHPGGGEAKYLENAFTAQGETAIAAIADSLWSSL